MPHNGRLFRNKLIAVIFQFVHIWEKIKLSWQDWDCFAPSFFWMRRPLSHRRGFEAPQSQQLWASLLHKQVTAHCGIFWVQWPSVQTPDGRTTTAAVFLLFDAFFQSIAESDAKSLSSMQRSAGEFCYSRTAEVCRLSSECCCTHTHCAGACSLLHHFAFIFILFSCNLWL